MARSAWRRSPTNCSPSNVGTSREIATHYMNQFRRQGYLKYSRNEIILYRDAFRDWLRLNA